MDVHLRRRLAEEEAANRVVNRDFEGTLIFNGVIARRERCECDTRSLVDPPLEVDGGLARFVLGALLHWVVVVWLCSRWGEGEDGVPALDRDGGPLGDMNPIESCHGLNVASTFEVFEQGGPFFQLLAF